jgi:hypothetical protein
MSPAAAAYHHSNSSIPPSACHYVVNMLVEELCNAPFPRALLHGLLQQQQQQQQQEQLVRTENAEKQHERTVLLHQQQSELLLRTLRQPGTALVTSSSSSSRKDSLPGFSLSSAAPVSLTSSHILDGAVPLVVLPAGYEGSSNSSTGSSSSSCEGILLQALHGSSAPAMLLVTTLVSGQGDEEGCLTSEEVALLLRLRAKPSVPLLQQDGTTANGLLQNNMWPSPDEQQQQFDHGCWLLLDPSGKFGDLADFTNIPGTPELLMIKWAL